jgi:hypothetical protein
MRTDYPAKVLMAWAEAIGGHTELRDWLIKNGYPELGIFTYALHLKTDAREWLMKNGHPHLLAVITGVEGSKQALDWLEHNHFTILKRVALAGDGNEDVLHGLINDGHRELAMVAQRIHTVKTRIDEDNTDPHKFSRV